MHEPDICFSTNQRPALIPSPAANFGSYQQHGRERRHGDGHHSLYGEAEYCDRIGLVYRGKLIASGRRMI